MRGGEERIEMILMATKAPDSNEREEMVSTRFWWFLMSSREILSKRRLVYSLFESWLVLVIYFIRCRKFVNDV